MQQMQDLDRLVTERTSEILATLQNGANELKTEFTEAMLRERRTRPPRERGSIGLRVRQAATSGPGIFQIEWYRVQGKQRTKYLKRGKDKDGRISQHYRLGSFGRLTDWEKDLILKYEPQCARLRILQSHIGHIRLRFHLIDQAFKGTGLLPHDPDHPVIMEQPDQPE
ncbi:hypothetical protein CKO27_13390 [Thiocystis violacea]|nr:hypothetical protein [Thiocystis violacea]